LAESNAWSDFFHGFKARSPVHGARRTAEGKNSVRFDTGRKEGIILNVGARSGMDQFGQHCGCVLAFFLDVIEFVFSEIIERTGRLKKGARHKAQVARSKR
jgi:hypothetical protein